MSIMESSLRGGAGAEEFALDKIKYKVPTPESTFGNKRRKRNRGNVNLS